MDKETFRAFAAIASILRRKKAGLDAEVAATTDRLESIMFEDTGTLKASENEKQQAIADTQDMLCKAYEAHVLGTVAEAIREAVIPDDQESNPDRSDG